jgi:nitrite reductase/ring-hydroxylating ferredoxin subunit
MVRDARSLEPLPELTRVAIYRREVQASLERIWENVLDWEHLPWLHRSSFVGIRLAHRDRDGWRATVTLSPEQGGGEADIEVRIDRTRRRYVTRTLAGVGAGTEIATGLEPANLEQTRIEVAFYVPGVAVDQAEVVGAFYTRLYARLWDEDEVMMAGRERQLERLREPRRPAERDRKPREPIPLGRVIQVRERVPFVVEVGGQRFRVLDLGGQLVAHATVCPHMGGPLEAQDVHEGCVRCPWHGYRFDLHTGLSADGRALRLDRAPAIKVEGGEVYLCRD